ncbi:hypothetical protein ACP70R_000593 [Stipagrostis hirtigluma subsp. patula]
MARFVAALLAAAAALLIAAGWLGHAAPSTAEVFWRAVLPDSAVPDAVLRLLRSNNNVAGKGKAEGAWRPNAAPFDYKDYRRSSRAPASDHGAAPARAAAGKARDDTPFSYDYEAPSKGLEGSEARGDSPFNYKAPSERLEDAEARGDSPFNYDYNAPSERLGAGDSPYHYEYKASSERHGGGGGGAAISTARGATTTTTVFFHEEAVRVGQSLHFRFPPAEPAALGLLPRRAADAVPFSTAALPGALALLGVPPGSAQAAAMAETLRKCETPPLAGEAKFCATSLEALVERAMAALGTRDVRPVTSTLLRAGAPLQRYTVRAVRPVDGASFLACHDEAYPYTVYRCHGTGPARAYMLEMEGARGGGAVTLATVCHTDTSLWNPEHVSFKLLGTKPGGEPICHLMPYGHIIWAKNVKSSPA